MFLSCAQNNTPVIPTSQDKKIDQSRKRSNSEKGLSEKGLVFVVYANVTEVERDYIIPLERDPMPKVTYSPRRMSDLLSLRETSANFLPLRLSVIANNLTSWTIDEISPKQQARLP
jgi:hypothetical protein